MSIKLMDKAFSSKAGNALTKLILVKLADNANDDGICFPSYAKMAAQCEVSRPTAINHIKKLESMGYLTIKERKTDKGNVSNVYILHPEKWQPLDAFTSKADLPPLVNELNHPSKADLPPLVNELNPEPSIEPSVNHNINLTVNNARKKNQKSNDLSLLKEFGITDQLAEDFVKHRKACKATITKTALDGFQREADKAGIPVQEAVAISIERGWRGFKASWDWQGNGQQRGREPKSNLNKPWNTPEAWAEAF